MKPLCSIIIRTKNEERWISSCLKAIEKQLYDNYEIIIVDNESSDSTLKRSKGFIIEKIISISDYLPGKALNEGIKKASGKYIVCLSAHCIPVNDNWLGNLVQALEQDEDEGQGGDELDGDGAECRDGEQPRRRVALVLAP